MDVFHELGSEICDEVKSTDLAWLFDDAGFFRLYPMPGLSPRGQLPDPDNETMSKMVAVRQIFDSGFGTSLLRKYRAGENGPGSNGLYNDPKYKVIILGAVLMGVGAQIGKDDIDHLRHLALNTGSREGFALAFCDLGFRGPGLRQFLNALTQYQPGTPRDFESPSCFTCGKAKQDIGKEVSRCGRCHKAWFCDKVRYPASTPSGSMY